MDIKINILVKINFRQRPKLPMITIKLVPRINKKFQIQSFGREINFLYVIFDALCM